MSWDYGRRKKCELDINWWDQIIQIISSMSPNDVYIGDDLWFYIHTFSSKTTSE